MCHCIYWKCYNRIWRHSQVVRHGSATPLSPVRIWLSPLSRESFIDSLFFTRVARKIACLHADLASTLRNFNTMHLQKFLRNLRKVPVFTDNKSTHNIEVFIGNIFDAHILNFTYVLFRQGD